MVECFLQSVVSRHIGRYLFRDCVKLQNQTLHALQKRVVQISGDALSFLKTFFHSPAHYSRHLSQPQLIKSTEHEQKQENDRERNHAV